MEIEKIQSHEYADIFPMMDGTDFDNLKKDLTDNGFDRTRPIILHDSKILDGRNRFKACIELNIKPSFEKFEGEEPLKFVISTNLNRRHLTESQRACVSQDCLPFFEAEAKKREFGGIPVPNLEQGRSVEHAGKMFNVGKTYVSEAKKIKEVRPELFEEVKQGKRKLHEVFAEIKKEETILKLKEDVKEVESEELNLFEGDCLTEINKIENDSVACLIIDPPYGIDYQSNYKLAKHDKIDSDTSDAFKLLDKSLKMVKPKMKKDSHVYIFTTWKVYEKVKPIVEKYFEVKNCLIWNKNNWSMGDLNGNYAEKYEMIIFATQGNRRLLGEKRPINVLDFERTNNSNHPTEKPVELLKELIKNSTVEGEVVLDYFAGSGSTMVASKELNRVSYGIEKDKNYIDVIKGRLK